MNTIRSCRLCTYFDRTQSAKGQPGICRRNPPQLIVVPSQNALGQVAMNAMAAWPTVPDEGWCGSFELLMGVAKAN